MTKKEKFLSLVTEQDSTTIKNAAKRNKNRAVLRESGRIAIKVLMRLDELNWTQRDLANAMKVTPQQINKIVKGQQNLGLDTITKLQELLQIPILASYHEGVYQQQAPSYRTSCKYNVRHGLWERLQSPTRVMMQRVVYTHSETFDKTHHLTATFN